MNRMLIVLLLSLFANGCTSHYFIDGKKYDNEQLFQAATDEHRNAALNAVQTLTSPLTDKRLVVSIPSEETAYKENLRRHKEINGSEAAGLAIEQHRNLAKHGFKMSKVFFEGIQKAGIYTSVTINETPTMVNSLEPAKDYDVMYYTEPGIGSGQYFYASSKHGKQVFAYDRSGTTSTDKVRAFVEAAQALAIRE